MVSIMTQPSCHPPNQTGEPRGPCPPPVTFLPPGASTLAPVQPKGGLDRRRRGQKTTPESL